jgi:hypothetical protein
MPPNDEGHLPLWSAAEWRSGAQGTWPTKLSIPVAFKQLTKKFHIYPALATLFSTFNFMWLKPISLYFLLSVH